MATPDKGLMSQKDFVDAVLNTYIRLPETPDRVRHDDRYLAITWYRQGSALFQVKTAMLLATARRSFRDAESGSLEPIRSLRYFVPIVEEIQHLGVDESYLHYLEQKLSSVLGTKVSSESGAHVADEARQAHPTEQPSRT